MIVYVWNQNKHLQKSTEEYLEHMKEIRTVKRGKFGIKEWINQENILEKKLKPTGYIIIPCSQYCEAEGHLKLRSCLHGSIINYDPRTGNISKH